MNSMIRPAAVAGLAIILAVSAAWISGLIGTPQAPAETPPGAVDPAPLAERPQRDLTMVTLLPFDAIPSIDKPRYISVEEASEMFEPGERVVGISINGDHRAYSVPQLSRHEIVNDVIGGEPVAVTW